MLLKNIDEEAKKKIMSLENDYLAALKKLEAFFGDKEKVIEACLEEVTKQPTVGEKDYNGLVNLKTVILNNLNRLKVVDWRNILTTKSYSK